MSDTATPSTPSAPTSTAFSEAEQIAISRVLGRMPYLPLVSGYTTRPQTLAELLDTLGKFAAVLTTYGEQHNANEQALNQLRSDVAAFRRILGTAPKES